MYGYIEQIIQHHSQKYITSKGGDNLSNHKLTNCEIEYDKFFSSEFNKALCLEIKTNTSSLEKLYNIVKKMT